MFDYSIVVQSAVSSFNNAALFTPSFLWAALLALPLFLLVYFMSDNLLKSCKWNVLKKEKSKNILFLLLVEVSLFFWLIFANSGFEVIRDSFTWLPIVKSSILFVLTAAIIQKIRILDFKMPAVWETVKYKKIFIIALVLLVSLFSGISGQPELWIALMQSAAIIAGFILGTNSSKQWWTFTLNILLIFAITVAVLMQPEFFKFGQLGNLTYAHMFFLLILCALIVASLVLRNLKPVGLIRHSAFTKLKWLARIFIFLNIALFIFTESVPIFIGFSGLLLVVYGFSVWHQKSIHENLFNKIWAWMICCLGIVLTIPFITVLGLIYLKTYNDESKISDAKFLL